MEITTLRWAIASLHGGVCALALASVPLVALCFGVDSEPFQETTVAAAAVALL